MNYIFLMSTLFCSAFVLETDVKKAKLCKSGNRDEKLEMSVLLLDTFSVARSLIIF